MTRITYNGNGAVKKRPVFTPGGISVFTPQLWSFITKFRKLLNGRSHLVNASRKIIARIVVGPAANEDLVSFIIVLRFV